mgnify:CR=1 FL=1
MRRVKKGNKGELSKEQRERLRTALTQPCAHGRPSLLCPTCSGMKPVLGIGVGAEAALRKKQGKNKKG